MNLQYRIDLLSRLGEYILSEEPGWISAKENAGYENGWFTPSFVDLAVENIATSFLQKNILEKWTSDLAPAPSPKKVGIIMAGNIPAVGFHDWLCVFITGHKAIVKLSSRDKVLLPHLLDTLAGWEPAVREFTEFADMLKGCDAYIATGSNNSSRYFDYYFGKYAHVIRRNRTSVALLTGKESPEDLENLADDIFLFFGLGCRNVTKIYVPAGYDFIPLLTALKKYDHLAEHHKYKNNYDYNLALHLLNKVIYMSTPAILLVEQPALFSPISQLNYEFYEDSAAIEGLLRSSADLQCLVGGTGVPFGSAQSPAITDYADGINTLRFLRDI